MDGPTRSWPMADIEAPLAHDIVYGRGGLSNNHIGNKLFRLIVCEYKEQYGKCSRHEKTALAECLVRHWRAQSPPGRFLKHNKETDRWYDVGILARGKCSQLLREGPLKTLNLTKEQEEELNIKVQEFKAKVDQSNSSLLPPSPPASAPDTLPSPSPAPPSLPATMPETPPQSNNKKSRDRDVSPISVMDMPFFPVEDVAEAYKARRVEEQETSSALTSFFDNIQLPFRARAKRTTSNTSIDKEEAAPAKKRQALNPLASFLGGLFQETGTKTATFVQDNAASQPSFQAPPVQSEEITIPSQMLPTQQELATFSPDYKVAHAPTTTVCTNDCASRARKRNKMPASRRQRSVSRGRAVPSSRGKSLERLREMSVERLPKNMPRDIVFGDGNLDISGHSFSWRSLDLDLEDDPVLSDYQARMTEKSNHTRKSRASMDSLSVSSRSSVVMEDLEIEIGSLPGLFREQCDTGATTANFKNDYEPTHVEKAYAEMPTLDDVKDDDDMSWGSILDELGGAEDDGPMAEVDDGGGLQGRGTHPSMLSMSHEDEGTLRPRLLFAMADGSLGGGMRLPDLSVYEDCFMQV